MNARDDESRPMTEPTTHPADGESLQGWLGVYDPGAAKYPDSDHSPYGFVSNPESTNPSRALQRTNNFCGMENAQGFPSCARLRDCFSNFTSLYDFDLCVENNVHANLHGLHGGLWDCPVDLEAEGPLEVMRRDATRVRQGRPFVVASLKHGDGASEVVRLIHEIAGLDLAV